MTSKQNNNVIRRQCRGRNYVESKSKTDSGCFVDEELDKSLVGTESAARKLSPNEKQANSGKRLKGAFKAIAESDSSSQQSQVTQDVTRDEKEMITAVTDESKTNGSNTVFPSPEGRSDTEQQSEEFYCLYYSSSPNSTIEKKTCNSQGKKPPPVPPKPKFKRSSVPEFPTTDPIFAQLGTNQDLGLRSEHDGVFELRRRRHTVDGSSTLGNGVTLEKFRDTLSAQKSVQEYINRFDALAEVSVVQNTTATSKITSSSNKRSHQEVVQLEEREEEEYCNGNPSEDKPSKDETIKPSERRSLTQAVDLPTYRDKQNSNEKIAHNSNRPISRSISNGSFDDEIENFIDELDELYTLPGEGDAQQERSSDIKVPFSGGAEVSHSLVSNGMDKVLDTESTECKTSSSEYDGGQEVPLATAEDLAEPQYEFDEFVVYHDEEEEEEEEEYGVQVPEVLSSEDEEESEQEGSSFESSPQKNTVVSEEQSSNTVKRRDMISDSDGFITDASGYISECSSSSYDGSVNLSSLSVFSRPNSTLPCGKNGTEGVVSQVSDVAQMHEARDETDIRLGVPRMPSFKLKQRPHSTGGDFRDSPDGFLDQSNALKRRSWSVCDPQLELDEERSPFIRKVYQTPGIWRSVESSKQQTAETDSARRLFSDALSRYSPDLDHTHLVSSSHSPELRVEVSCSPSGNQHTQRRVSNVSSGLKNRATDDSLLASALHQNNSNSSIRRRGTFHGFGIHDGQRSRHIDKRTQQRRFSPAGSVEDLRIQTLRKLSSSTIESETKTKHNDCETSSARFSDSPGRTPRPSLPNDSHSLSKRFSNILEYAEGQPDDDVREMILEALRVEPELFLEDEELDRVLVAAEDLNMKRYLDSKGANIPSDSESCTSEAICGTPKTTACQTDDEEEFGLRRQTSDRETQTSQLQLAEKMVSAEELLQLLSSVTDLSVDSGRIHGNNGSVAGSSSSDLSGNSGDSSPSRSPLEMYTSEVGLNEPFPKPRRPLSIQRYPRNNLASQRAASTGNIHGGRGYHNVYGLYEHNRKAGLQHSYCTSIPKQSTAVTGNTRGQSRSVDSIMKDLYALRARGRRKGVIQARMVGCQKTVSENQKQSRKHLKPHYFEEEIDCMKTKETRDEVASDSGSSGSLDGSTSRSAKTLTVSYEGSELSGNESDDGHFIKARKSPVEMITRKARDDGGSSMRDKGFQLDDCDDQSETGSHSPNPPYDSDICHVNGHCTEPHFDRPPKYEEAVGDSQSREQQIDSVMSPDSTHDGGNEVGLLSEQSREIDNGVCVFIDYKKKIMRVSENKDKPDSHSDEIETEEALKASKSSAQQCTSMSTFGATKDMDLSGQRTSPQRDLYSIWEERSPSDSGSLDRRSLSSFSSDDGAFGEFGGSMETVVLAGEKEGDGTSSTSVPLATNSLDKRLQEAKSSSSRSSDKRASLEIERVLSNVKDQLDEDLMNNDLFDAALDRVRERLSPMVGEASRGLTMEAFVALHQADELQAIINEIKGEMKLLQDENSMLRQKVVNLSGVHSKHSEVKTSGQPTQNSSTQSSERAAACQSQRTIQQAHSRTDPKQGQSSSRNDMFELDVYLEGFTAGNTVIGSLQEHKKCEQHVKLGSIRISNETDWHDVYEATVKIFMEHLKSLDPELKLGLGSKSIKKLQTGVEMWTPGTLPRKGPRVELTKQSNPCVIKLKDGSDGCCDELVYGSLLPRELIENFVYQVLQHRHVVLCGSQGLGKSHLASRLAEHIVQRLGYVRYPAIVTLDVNQTPRKEVRQTLNKFMRCDISSQPDGVPAVIVLDHLNCLSSLNDIFDANLLERKRHSPFLIGVRNKSKKGPFSSKDLALYQYFRWIQISIHDNAVDGLLYRFLKRKLSWSPDVSRTEEEKLMVLFDWLLGVWRHVNHILEEYCGYDATLGPGLFYACPMEYKSAENWFVSVWNHTVVPFMQKKLLGSTKIYDRDASWEDPTKWVIMRYPWNRETSKVLHKLKKIRQVDIVLHRNLEASYSEGDLDKNVPEPPFTKVHPKKIEQMKVLSTRSQEKIVYIDDSASEISESDRLSETSL